MEAAPREVLADDPRLAPSTPFPVRVLDRALAAAFRRGEIFLPLTLYLGCAVLALMAIWAHQYPAGTDLPQHAHLFRLWTELGSGPVESRDLYRTQLFTPYLLTYALAYPLTLAFGALGATKVLLSACALGTPLALRRWLRAVGAPPQLGLVGFVVAFDLGYLWGFLSYALSIPLALEYLTAVERQAERPRWTRRRAGGAALLAVALFFCHGITFVFAAAVVALTALARGRRGQPARHLLHLLPAVTLAGLWLALRRAEAGAHATGEWLSADRVRALLSGPFAPFPDRDWALVAAAGLALFAIVARPRLVGGAARLVPVGVALLAFLALPEWLGSAWLVATRFCVLVHVFAPACLRPRTDRVARWWPHLLFALVATYLVVLNVRLLAFNRELAGLDAVAAAIPPGSDVETLVPATAPDSAIFGAGELGQVPAWITAQQGGLIANDSAVYYQLPLRRNPVPFPARARYVIARGFPGHPALAEVRAAGRLLQASGAWLLFERAPVESGGLTVTRWGQEWGRLQRDRAVTEKPLSIGGTKYAHGLGTHGRSFVRVRVGPATRLEGKCGVDDAAGPLGHARFRVRDDAGRVLFDSGPRAGGEAATSFSIALEGRRELVLEVLLVSGLARAHADWVDLAVR
jgi:hypothetical protein